MLAVAGLILLATSRQDAVTLKRTYAVSEKDAYRIVMSIEGQLEYRMSAKMTMTVKKVHEKGDADIETRMDDLEVMMMGDPLKTPKLKPTVSRVSPFGIVVADKAGSSVMGLDMMRYAFISPEQPMKVGESVPISTDEKSGVAGTVRLDTLKDGVADLTYSMDIKTPGGTPMKMSLLRTVEVATGKTTKAVGTVTNLPQSPQGGRVDRVVFTFDRVK